MGFGCPEIMLLSARELECIEPYNTDDAYTGHFNPFSPYLGADSFKDDKPSTLNSFIVQRATCDNDTLSARIGPTSIVTRFHLLHAVPKQVMDKLQLQPHDRHQSTINSPINRSAPISYNLSHLLRTSTPGRFNLNWRTVSMVNANASGPHPTIGRKLGTIGL